MKNKTSRLLTGLLGIVLLVQLGLVPVAAAQPQPEQDPPTIEWVDELPEPEPEKPQEQQGQGDEAPTENRDETQNDPVDDSIGSEEPQAEGEGFSLINPTAIVNGQEYDNIADIITALKANGEIDDEEPNTILDFFDLTFKTPDDETVETPSLGDIFNMEIQFTLPDYLTEILTGGEYYEFTMPPELQITAAQSIPLEREINGVVVQFGSIEIATDGSVRIEFNENIALAEGEVQGGGLIYGTLIEGDMENPGDNIIKIPDEDEVEGVPIVVKPGIDASLDKDGELNRKYNPDSVTWTMEFNKNMDELTNVVFTDPLPAQVLAPPTSLVVYGFEVDFAGNPIPGSEYEIFEPDFTLVSNGADGTVQIEFASLDHPVRVVMETAIDRSDVDENGASFQISNNATLTADGGVNLPGSASVEAQYRGRIAKNATGYDPETQTVTWDVEFNYDQAQLDGNTFVTDSIPNGMELLNGTGEFLVREVIINPDGTATIGGDLPEVLYEIVYNPDGSFTILFPEGLDGQAVNIQYKTQVVGILDEDSVYNNVIEDDQGHSDGDEQNVGQRNIIKTLQSYDVANNTVTWRLEVNLRNEEMHNWVLTDTSERMELLYETLSVYNRETGQTLNGDMFPVNTGDYMVQVDNPPNGFTLSLLNDYNPTSNSFIITYTTRYDTVNLPETLTNTATVNWTDSSGGGHTSDDDAVYRPSVSQQQNGQKGGRYNAQTKEITWYIAVNYAGTELLNSYIDDPIEDPQNFVPGSVHIYTYSQTPGGIIQRGEEISDDKYQEFTILEPQNNPDGYNLHIDLPFGDADALYYIEYRTSLQGELIGENVYYNTALFHNDATDDFTLSANVSVANGGSYVGKQGFQDENDQVSWSITVNPSQSTLYNVVVRDVPGANQLIDLDTVGVYPTTVEENGKINIDTTAPLVEGTDYTIDYYQNDDGLWEMDVSFINDYAEIDRPYIITYDVTVLAGGESPGTSITLTNDATIEYEYGEPGEQGGGSEIGVDVGGGSGWISGEVGGISFRKIDPVSGATLQGLEFQLTYLGANGTATPRVLGTATTDENGIIAFGSLPHGMYELEELNSLPGYSMLSPNPYTFTLNRTTTGTTVRIVNQPSAITLTKRDSEDNRLVPNTTFALYEVGNPTALGSYTTGAGGTLTIYGLDEGSYYLVETAAAPGYVPDTITQYPFTITRDGEGQLVVSALGGVQNNTVLNVPTEMLLYKTDETGVVPQPGAEFDLQVNSNGAWQTIGSYTSGADGVIRILRLPVNAEYRIVETEAPEEYARNTEPYYFNINAAGEVEYIGSESLGADAQRYRNWPIIVRMPKRDSVSGAGLFGAIYELYEAEYAADNTTIIGYNRIRENEVFYTDRNGLLLIGRLAAGTDYYIQEVSAPPGYSLNPEQVYFNVPVEYYDPETGAWLDILDLDPMFNVPSDTGLVKYDEEGGLLPGATFRLERNYAAGGAPDDWLPVLGYEAVTTGENGSLEILALPAGRYRFIETAAPDGYLLDPTPIEFEMVMDDAGQLIPVTLTVTNLPTSVTLQKQSPTGTPLPGATFMLEQQQPDGSWLQIRPDEALVTGEDGSITVTKLTSGTYRLTEVNAPDGYMLVTTPVVFTVAVGQQTAITLDAFINPPTEVLLQKQDETGTGLSGAEFQLFRRLGGGWQRLYEGDALVTGADGQLRFTGLTAGDYRLVEVAAPAGYLLNPAPVDFTLAPNTTEALVLPVFLNEFAAVTLLKTDEAANRLAGAVFTLQQYTVATGWQALQTGLTSDANGVISVSGLAAGRYRFIETAAPAGYLLDDAPIEFILEENATKGVLAGTHVNRPVPPVVASPAATGESGVRVFVAVLCIAAAALCLLIFLRARRKKG